MNKQKQDMMLTMSKKNLKKAEKAQQRLEKKKFYEENREKFSINTNNRENIKEHVEIMNDYENTEFNNLFN